MIAKEYLHIIFPTTKINPRCIFYQLACLDKPVTETLTDSIYLGWLCIACEWRSMEVCIPCIHGVLFPSALPPSCIIMLATSLSHGGCSATGTIFHEENVQQRSVQEKS